MRMASPARDVPARPAHSPLSPATGRTIGGPPDPNRAGPLIRTAVSSHAAPGA
jgi:hypothetical protein